MGEDDSEIAGAAGVEVAWIDAGSQEHTAGLDDVADVAFEDSVQVRGFPSYRRQRHFPGLWWLATTGRHVGFESWLERDLIRTLRRVIDIAERDRNRLLIVSAK